MLGKRYISARILSAFSVMRSKFNFNNDINLSKLNPLFQVFHERWEVQHFSGSSSWLFLRSRKSPLMNGFLNHLGNLQPIAYVKTSFNVFFTVYYWFVIVLDWTYHPSPEHFPFSLFFTWPIDTYQDCQQQASKGNAYWVPWRDNENQCWYSST